MLHQASDPAPALCSPRASLLNRLNPGCGPSTSACAIPHLQVFCKRRPEIHLFAARYAERHGDVDAARAGFKHLAQTLAPRLLEAVTAAANFERRQVRSAGRRAASPGVRTCAWVCVHAKEGIQELMEQEHLCVYTCIRCARMWQ